MERRAWMKTGMILGLFLVAGVSGCGDDGGGPDDTRAPAAVTDLAAGSATASSITLTWTATGDDSLTGKAASYDLRYSTGSLSEATFSSATAVSGIPAPKASGSRENFLVTGLQYLTGYQFALKVRDEAGNVSELSNIVADTTTPGTGQCPPTLSGRIALAIIYPPLGGHDGEIFVFDVGTGELSQATDNSDYDLYPRWSPDGDRIACSRGWSRWDIAVVDPVGGGEIALVASGDNKDVKENHWWSPDGEWILCVTTNAEDNNDLILISPDDLQRDTLVHDTRIGLSGYGSPWSPNGQSVVYGCSEGDLYGLRIVDVASGQSRHLVDDGWSPVWFCQQEQVLFARDSDNDFWRVDAQGSDAEYCATIGQEWKLSPDCNWIAFDQSSELRLLDLATCTGEPLPASTNNVVVLAWSPDSRHVLLRLHQSAGDRDSLVVYDSAVGSLIPMTCLTSKLPGDSLLIESADWTE